MCIYFLKCKIYLPCVYVFSQYIYLPCVYVFFSNAGFISPRCTYFVKYKIYIPQVQAVSQIQGLSPLAVGVFFKYNIYLPQLQVFFQIQDLSPLAVGIFFQIQDLSPLVVGKNYFLKCKIYLLLEWVFFFILVGPNRSCELLGIYLLCQHFPRSIYFFKTFRSNTEINCCRNMQFKISI